MLSRRAAPSPWQGVHRLGRNLRTADTCLDTCTCDGCEFAEPHKSRTVRACASPRRRRIRNGRRA